MADIFEIMDVIDIHNNYDEHHAIHRRVMRDRNNPFDIYSDVEFKLRYRFNKETVQVLINLLRDPLTRQTKRSFALSPEIQVGINMYSYIMNNSN